MKHSVARPLAKIVVSMEAGDERNEDGCGEHDDDLLQRVEDKFPNGGLSSGK